MNDTSEAQKKAQVEALYEESVHWHVNTGDETIHAKRMSGRFRNLKWFTHSLWLLFFLGPFLRWDERQAVLFDIPGRQFHIFGITILPQDVWMLSLVLLFFAILLAAVTSVAGRVFCGYFCFQTVWTDLFTLIEEKLEGAPPKRRKLEQAPWDLTKIRIKGIKHTLWLLISVATGISFAAWFTDAYQLWVDVFTLQAPTAAYGTIALFIPGTYILAGFLREQTCFWLCPYARIQGVMYDSDTILPTYDFKRGETRGKLKKGKTQEGFGDCVDCSQCVAVCPTGIDIRAGQQEGCITCALCIDACDSVMDKIGKERGLIRYASLDEIEGKTMPPLYKRPRVLVYFSILALSLTGIIYGLTNLGALELKAIHERQPLFVRLSDGNIQNKFDLKILNKTDKPMAITVTASGPEGLQLVGVENGLELRERKLTAHTVFLKLPAKQLKEARVPVTFHVQAADDEKISATYKSMFFGPRR